MTYNIEADIRFLEDAERQRSDRKISEDMLRIVKEIQVNPHILHHEFRRLWSECFENAVQLGGTVFNRLERSGREGNENMNQHFLNIAQTYWIRFRVYLETLRINCQKSGRDDLEVKLNEVRDEINDIFDFFSVYCCLLGEKKQFPQDIGERLKIISDKNRNTPLS
jgi:hypothetical protein